MFHNGASDDDDNLPDIPTTAVPPLTLAEQQMRRMTALEEELRMMKQPLTPTSSDDAVENDSGGVASSRVSHSTQPNALRADTERLLCELRAAVPHLSAHFSCSYQDCHLLLAAIRNGTAVTVPGQLSVSQKLQSVEAENRGLQHKCQRQQDATQALKDELASARQTAHVTQKDANRRAALLSQRVEESRKQLLMEEGRSQRLQVKVRQLEAEVEALRDKLRAHLR